MTAEEAHAILYPHGLTLLYVPTNQPNVWAIVPHALHPGLELEAEVFVLVAAGSSPELAVAAWRADLHANN